MSVLPPSGDDVRRGIDGVRGSDAPPPSEPRPPAKRGLRARPGPTRLKCDDCGRQTARNSAQGRYRLTIVGVDYDANSRRHAGNWAEWNLCAYCQRARIALGYTKVEYLGPPQDVAPMSGGPDTPGTSGSSPNSR